MQIGNKLLSFMTSIENFAVSVFSILIIVIVNVDVIGRYLFAHSLTWSMEATKILYIWLSFIALSLTMRDGRKGIIAVDYIEENLPESKTKRYIVIIKHILTIAAFVLLLYATFFAIKLSIHGKTPTLRFPFWLMYGGGFLGLIFTFIRTIIRAVEVFKKGVNVQ